MNILLTGAGGFIGRNLFRALIASGHRIVPASRTSGFDFCRMQTVADWLPHLRGIDAVINSVGIIGERGRQRFTALHTTAPSALFTACAQTGIRRVVQISALGTDGSAFSAYHLSKRAADDCLRRLDLDWFVLRPSLVYGPGGRSAGLFLRLAALPRIPVIAEGSQALQPVHITDVVATVLECLRTTRAKLTLDIVGDETVTFADWLQRMRLAQGLPPAALLRIPLPLALALARLGRHLHPIFQPDNLHMLAAGYHADAGPITRFLGRAPQPFSPRLFFTAALPTGSES